MLPVPPATAARGRSARQLWHQTALNLFVAYWTTLLSPEYQQRKVALCHSLSAHHRRRQFAAVRITQCSTITPRWALLCVLCMIAELTTNHAYTSWQPLAQHHTTLRYRRALASSSLQRQLDLVSLLLALTTLQVRLRILCSQTCMTVSTQVLLMAQAHEGFSAAYVQACEPCSPGRHGRA